MRRLLMEMAEQRIGDGYCSGGTGKEMTEEARGK